MNPGYAALFTVVLVSFCRTSNGCSGKGSTTTVLFSLPMLVTVCQKAKLNSRRVLLEDRGRVAQARRRMELPFGVNDLARRSRSLSACRAMARCMMSGRSTCFTSTADTLTPHGSVC